MGIPEMMYSRVLELEAKLADANAKLEAARGMAKLLRKIEYVPNGFGYDICPACTMSGISGHEDNCGLRKALNAWREASNTSAESADTNNKGESK
jgi:hypothetical protein